MTYTAPATRPDLLLDVARRLARAEPCWRPHVHHDAADRRPVRLLATDAFEAWVIGWTPGQGVDLHDHGDAAGALTVVEGTLVDLVPIGGRLRPRELNRGATIALSAGLVHDVVAPGPTPATSIHVYSPWLTQMSFYDGDGQRVRTVSVAPEAPALSPREVSRALHPASAAS